MKRAVSLNQLLNGNSDTKKAKIKENKNNKKSNEPETIELLDSPKKEEENHIQTKKSKIIPIGDNVATASVKNFLMMKPPKVDKPVSKPKDKIKSSEKGKSNQNFISLDDTDDSNDKDDQLAVQEVINLENENFENIVNPKRLSGPISNVKRTNLKDLFSSMRKPKDKEEPNEEEEYRTRPFKRLNPISKLAELPTPLPAKQLIQSIEDVEGLTQIGEVSIEQLKQKKVHTASSEYIFDSNDYEVLRNKLNREVATNIIETSIKHTNHSTLWTELFQPKTLSEVLLDTRLKRGVNRWINDAFSKLKKPTTRHTLINSPKNLKSTVPGTLLFDGFIIPDDMIDDDDEDGLEEFVPLMILHGDGVGKTTLINVIMQEMKGQILDINSSQNRSKKELLDMLSEYCTSHYVKDKKSYGIVLFDDVDVLFREHDKQFWVMVEMILLKSRKPIILVCKDINFIPTNLIDLCEESQSLFEAKKVLSKTVLAFLTEYCKTIGLEIPNNVLSSIIKSNQKDIRKCLFQLQFLFSYKNDLIITQGSNEDKIPTPETIADYSKIHDLISENEIVDSHTMYKSLIPPDIDATLMTPSAIERLNSTEDEQIRLKNDYMVDYRLNISDQLRNLLLPYELSVGKYLNYQLREHTGKCPDFNKKLDTMEKRSVYFLTSRIPARHLSNIRKTRNSRKVKEILDRFQGEVDYQRENHDDTIVDFNFFMTTKKKIAQDLNPYVLEIAKSDSNTKNFNKEQFEAASKDVPESDHGEIVHHLSTEGIFRTVRFYSNPQKVIDCWSSLQTLDDQN